MSLYGREGNQSPVLGFLGVESEFPPFICMGGGGIQSPVLGFLGVDSESFSLFSIHLNGCLRTPIYPLLLPSQKLKKKQHKSDATHVSPSGQRQFSENVITGIPCDNRFALLEEESNPEASAWSNVINETIISNLPIPISVSNPTESILSYKDVPYVDCSHIQQLQEEEKLITSLCNKRREEISITYITLCKITFCNLFNKRRERSLSITKY